jgi:hypothetical protein
MDVVPTTTETLAPPDFRRSADSDELAKLRREVSELTSLVRETITITTPTPPCALTALAPLTVRQECHRIRQQCLTQRQHLLMQRAKLLAQRQRLYALGQRLTRYLCERERM